MSNRGDIRCISDCSGSMSDIAKINSGNESAALVQKRRVMSTNSGLGASAKLTVRRSRAMPQIGHEPGSGRTISGYIGQTYSVLFKGTEGAAGSSAMPHFGHAPGV